MIVLFMGILEGTLWLIAALFSLIFLLALWYTVVKLAAFAWIRGRKEAQNPQNRSNDGR